MLVRHDFVTLHADGIRYLEKAPLFYWLMAASIKLLGATTAAARLPLALSVLALALLLEAFARNLLQSARAGLYAGLITLSSFGIFIFSRINIPDVLVCVFLAAALFVFDRTEAAPERPAVAAALGFGAFCALDVLTKGLIGVVFPLAIVGVSLVLTRGFRLAVVRCRELHPGAALLSFLAVAAPWHVLAALANPSRGHPGSVAFRGGHWSVPLPSDGNVHGWAWFYFVNEQVLRYLNLRVPHDYDTVPLWLFLGLIFAWLIPWSAFLPAALAKALPLASAAYRERLRRGALDEGERARLLMVVWAAVPLAFFAFSTRQEYYVLPALPPMILLIAGQLCERTDRQARAACGLLGLGLLSLLICGYFLLHTRHPEPGTDLATLLSRHPADYALSFGHFLDLNAAALGLFRFSLILTPVTLLGGALTHWLLRRGGHTHAATLALAGTAFVFLISANAAFVTFAPTLSSYELARTIAPQIRQDDLIVIYGEYESASTLAFYLRRDNLHLLAGRSSNLWYGSFFPDAPRVFETRSSLAASWRSAERVFVWQNPSDETRPPLTAEELGGPVYVVAQGGGKQILSNRPGDPR